MHLVSSLSRMCTKIGSAVFFGYFNLTGSDKIWLDLSNIDIKTA